MSATGAWPPVRRLTTFSAALFTIGLLLSSSLGAAASSGGTIVAATRGNRAPASVGTGADRAFPLAENRQVEQAIHLLDAWLDAYRDYNDLPGISAGFVVDQDLLWSDGYGFANVEEKVPATAETIYSICSISKLFTAVSVLKLRDEGKLELRDPVSKHLAWFDLEQAFPASGPVTIEGLLTHSSGLPRESDYPYWSGPDFPFPSRQELIEKLKEQETLYPASSFFQYSNLGLSLAGEIVAARSGMPYAEYVQKTILSPLGLDDTRPYLPVELHGGKMAIGYSASDRSGERDRLPAFDTAGIAAAAGYTSNVVDLAKFASWQFRLLDGIDSGKQTTEILDANTLREMQRVHWMDPDWQTTWGLGFSIRREEDQTLVGHTGGCPGYLTALSLSPTKRVAAVALTNANGHNVSLIASNILKVLGPAIEKARKNAGEDDADVRATDPEPDFSLYSGSYDARPWGGETLILPWEDGLAAFQLPSDDPLKGMTKLKHIEGHVFRRVRDHDEGLGETWTFDVNDEGAAVSVSSHSNPSPRIR